MQFIVLDNDSRAVHSPKVGKTLDNELQANVVGITVAMLAMGFEVRSLKLLKFEVIKVIEV